MHPSSQRCRLTLLGLLLASATLAPTPAAGLTDLRCALQAPARVASGQPVLLRLTITNRSRTGVHLLVWGTPFEGWFGPFVIVRRDGAPISYRGPSVKRADPGREEYLHLAPGQSRSASIDLAEAFDLRQSGRYRVEPRILLHDIFVDGEAGPPRPLDSHTTQPLGCEALEFQVRALPD